MSALSGDSSLPFNWRSTSNHAGAATSDTRAILESEQEASLQLSAIRSQLTQLAGRVATIQSIVLDDRPRSLKLEGTLTFDPADGRGQQLVIIPHVPGTVASGHLFLRFTKPNNNRVFLNLMCDGSILYGVATGSGETVGLDFACTELKLLVDDDSDGVDQGPLRVHMLNVSYTVARSSLLRASQIESQ